MASIIKSASSSPIAFCRTSVHRTRLTNCAKARACAGSSSIQTSASCPICPVLPVNVPITVYGTVCELSRLFFRVNCGCDRKKGTQTGKKGQLTGKKGQFAGCQKRRKPLLHKALRAVLARARKKTRKNKKKTSKKPRCRNPACGQLPALLACQGTGHPCGVPPPLRGGSPSPYRAPPRGANPAPRLRGAAPGAASPCLPALAGGNLGSRAARRFACFVLPLGRAWVVPGQSRAAALSGGGPCPRFAAGRASHPLHP